MTFARCCALAFLLAFLSATAPSQIPYTPDAGKVGLPMNGVFSGGSIDSVQMNNGNLHVDIPLLHLPGVGMDADFHFVYDNQVFTVTQVPYIWGPTGPPTYNWQLITMSRYMASVNDPLSGYLKIGEHTEHWECGNPYPVWQGSVTNIDFISFSDVNGTPHSIPGNGYPSSETEYCIPSTPYPQNNFSSDAEGYHLITNSSGVETSLTDKHGTKYTFAGSQLGGGNVPVYAQNPNVPQNPVIAPMLLYYNPLSKIEDVNGNTISSTSGGIVDTLGRTITESAGPAFAPQSTIAVETLGNQLSEISYQDPNQTTPTQTIVINYGPVTINLGEACNEQGGATTNCGPLVGTEAGNITVQLPSSIVLQNGDTYSFYYNQGGLGELQEIVLPTGGTIQYTYTAPQGRGGGVSRSVASRTVTANGQTSTWTFNGTTVTDPYGNDTVYTCGLSWPCYMTNEVMYNGSAVTGTPLVTRATTYTQYGCAILPTAELFTWDESGQTTETDTTYDSISTTGSDIVCPDVSSGSDYPSNTSRGLPYSKIVYDYGTTAGTHGPLISNMQYAYLQGSNSSYANATSTDPNIADRVAQVSVYNSATQSSSTLVAQTTTAYDSFTSGGQSGLSTNAWSSNHDATIGTSVTLRGIPTSVTKYVGASSPSIVSYTNYNILGQPTALTDALGNTATLTYSGTASGCTSDFLTTTTLPSTTTNGIAIPHVTKQYEAPCTSLVMEKIDQNGNPTTFTYDPRMRPLVESRPDGGSTTNSYPTDNEVVTVVKEDNTRSSTTTVTLDGVGRKISTNTTADATCGPLTVDTFYDQMNRVQSVSNPHCSSTQVTDGYSVYTYDAIGRMTNKQNPDGTAQTWQFSGSTINSWDENQNEWQHIYDANDRLVKVKEPNGTTSTNIAPILETDYSYDALGNLLRVDQWGGPSGSSGDHVRQFAYDGVSRLIASNNPESASPSNPAALTCTGTTSGTHWTGCYSYDNNGNLKQKTDNRSISINYSFDKLNRLLTKTYSDSTPPATFVYDATSLTASSPPNPPNPIGELTQATTSVGTTTLAQTSNYLFDAMGRLQFERQCTPANMATCSSSPYEVDRLYDLVGKPTFETFPSNAPGNSYPSGQPLNITYVNDSAGRLLSASTNWSATGDTKHPGTLFQAPPPSSSLPAYGPMGLLNATLGINSSAGTTTATVQRGYDDRGRVVSGVYAAGSGAIIDSRSTGSITISGSETTASVASQKGTVTLSDPTQGALFGSYPYEYYNTSMHELYCQTDYYAGSITITVQSTPSFSASATWGESNESQGPVRTALVAGLNGSGSPVSATLNANNTITLVSVATGISANYPVTVGQTQYSVQQGNSSPCN